LKDIGCENPEQFYQYDSVPKYLAMNTPCLFLYSLPNEHSTEEKAFVDNLTLYPIFMQFHIPDLS